MRSAPAQFLENTQLKEVTDRMFAELDAYNKQPMQLILLNIDDGQFSQSWNDLDVSTSHFSVDKIVQQTLDVKGDREKPQWKLIRYECLSDPSFRFIPAMRFA